MIDPAELVHVDTERRTIDADAWLAALSPWYRAACAGIVRHWARILTLPSVSSKPDEWLSLLRRSAGALTAPTVGTRAARGVIEWRHPEDRLKADCITALCWVGDASRGLGGTYLCWTALENLMCLGGACWDRDLSTLTPLGGAAEDIVAYVAYQLALEGP